MSSVFHRGMYLPSWKEPAANRAIEDLRTPAKVYLPLSLYGEAKCTLRKYATVLFGQQISEPKKAGGGAPSLSTVSGVYSDKKTIDHPLYGSLTCLVLDCMDTGTPAPSPHADTNNLTPEQVIEIARTYCVVDELDGKYLCDKLTEWAADCDVLVGDGVENQPYASAAWEVLSESAEEVFAGLQLAAYATGTKEMHLSVQPLPHNHRRALCQRLGGDDKLFTVRGKYPAVAYTEKPRGKRVRRIGVQALLALYRAAAYHEPHTSTVVTVTGGAVSTPRNLRVPFGTPATDLFRLCGLCSDPTVVVFGDMMTGTAIADADLPILPGVTCLLALTDPPLPPADVCVGCGRCVQVCHTNLMPTSIMKYLLRQETPPSFLHTELCDGCGACSAVCPSGLQLSKAVFAAGKVRKEAENHE